MASIDPMVLVGVVLALVSVGVLFGALRALTGRRDVVVDRLQRTRGTGVGEASELVLGKSVPKAVQSLAKIADPGASEDGQQLRRQLIRAGLRGENVVQIFLASKVLIAVLAPSVFLTVNAQLQEPLAAAAPLAVVLCSLGFYLPTIWVASRVRERQQKIERGLPETLDLLVTCVEAGLGLDAALSRVAEETRLASPILADELSLTFLEVQAGVPRVDAFRRLSLRTGVEDLRSLAATLAQSEIFGTSVATALRVRAEWIRTRRMQKAEEKAAIVAVKMTIPLVFCILPSLVAVVMGPAVIRIFKGLLPSLG